MIEISIDLRGAQNLVNGSAILRRSIAEGAEDSAVYVLGRMKEYPTQRSGVNYRRTGTLKRSWHMGLITTGRNPSSRVSSNGNIAPYNRWVQDRTRQASFHRGTWPNTAQQVASDSIETTVEFYRTRIRRNFEI